MLALCCTIGQLSSATRARQSHTSQTLMGFLPLPLLSSSAGIRPFGLTASNQSLFCSFLENEVLTNS